ncbi:hypothetical protein FA10DRAFT_263202 [Acaromyces ingoldii]|uniref:Uncharacterized protein n=1 Tax=Acaromyces ingoldii TaxID=215250 RepID=A0A316YDF6_9BASI|nr:hypothetical protein FA10DRAFT_263202 [Acaromyces ingoldii]PWN86698.1 hypothetical protein FA10DRAFT_263202 [Acaromyces ingoldii]
MVTISRRHQFTSLSKRYWSSAAVRIAVSSPALKGKPMRPLFLFRIVPRGCFSHEHVEAPQHDFEIIDKWFLTVTERGLRKLEERATVDYVLKGNQGGVELAVMAFVANLDDRGNSFLYDSLVFGKPVADSAKGQMPSSSVPGNYQRQLEAGS